MNRENLIVFYKEYVNNGGKISPMRTEACRKFLEKRSGVKVKSEDVLWLFYNAK